MLNIQRVGQRVSDLEKENSCLRQGRVSHDNETLS